MNRLNPYSRLFWIFTFLIGSSSSILSEPTPLDIRIVGTLPLTNYVAGEGAVLQNDYLYVSASGLTVIDVHDPVAPHVVSHLSDGYGSTGPVLAGNTLCLIIQSTLTCFDISVPTSPRPMGKLRNIAATGAASVGNHLVTANGDGITIIDVADASSPQIISRFAVNVGQDKIVASGHFVYIRDVEGHIAMLDLSDPSNPKLGGKIPAPTTRTITAQILATQGTDLFINRQVQTPQGTSWDVAVCDVSNPLALTVPKPIPATREQVRATSLARSGDTIVYSDDGGQVIVATKDSTGNPTIGGFLLIRNGTRGPLSQPAILGTSGRYAYLTLQGTVPDKLASELLVVDISAPSTYLPINHFESARIVGVQDGNAFLSTFGGRSVVGTNTYETDLLPPLVSIDLSAPISSLTVPTNSPSLGYDAHSINGLVINHDTAAAIVDERTLVIYDLTNPSKPSIDASLDVSDFGIPLGRLTGGAALAANSSDIFVTDQAQPVIWRVDISDTKHPVVVGELDASQPLFYGGPVLSMAVSKSVLYASDGFRLLAFNVAGPANLVLITPSIIGPGGDNLVVEDDMLAVTGIHYPGITLYDISDPAQPGTIGTYLSENRYKSICFRGDYIYAVNEAHGVDILDISDRISAKRVGGNALAGVSRIFSSRDVLIATSLEDGSSGVGDSYILPPFEKTPAYTPFAQTASSDGFQFKLRGIPGTTARVQRSTTLVDWADWTSVTLGTNTISVLDPDATGTKQFYRVAAP